MSGHYFSSLTRITDLENGRFDVRGLERGCWSDGDFVVGEVVCEPGPLTKVELPDGRHADLFPGDFVLGAFGARRATLEAVGDWRWIGDDLRMHALTNAGLFGKCTSLSPYLPHLTELVYRGHVLRSGEKAVMASFVRAPEAPPFSLPVVMLVGSSMSSGKTTCARVVISRLRKMGLRVVAVKATGACRYGEILSMADSGADRILDFVDAGLPSTACPENQYRAAFGVLQAKMSAAACDVAVIELGASLLEPYNGWTVLEALESNVRVMILCASDPYAVAGVRTAFPLKVDLVSGICCNTTAAIDLIGRLTGQNALNLLLEESLPCLDDLLKRRLWTSSNQPDSDVESQPAT